MSVPADAEVGDDGATVLILAPLGRDGPLAAGLLGEDGFATRLCSSITELVETLRHGAGLALLTQEAVKNTNLHALAGWVAEQPAWSDFPFIVATERGGGPERNPAAMRLIEALGNVTFLERPFHPFTLVSVARTALRSRRRQYQSRDQLEELAQRQRIIEEREAQFRTLADNVPVLAWTARADGEVYWYNSRWYDYTGTTPEDMKDGGWRRAHDPALLPSVVERWQASLASGTPFEMVFPLRRADGEMRPFLTRVAPLRDSNGNVEAWFGTNIDISAERAAEEAARASEERLRLALAAGKLGSWDYDSETGALRCSDVCKANLGRPGDAVLTVDDALQAIHPVDRSEIRATVAAALHDSKDCAVECRVVWPDGSLHWVEVRGRSVASAGQPTRLTGVSVDITERKEAEAELRDHRERLEELIDERTRDLADTLDRLRTEVAERERAEEALHQSQKMEAIGQLTGGIAHDFNNLLTGIGGCVEMMQTRVVQGRIQDLGRYMTAAKESIDRAASLTHRLLAFARRQTLERKPIDMNRLAAGMDDLIRRTVGPAIELDLVFASGLWMTFCDGNQLESALLNLCINAKDAMPEGGRLTIETANTRLDDAYALSAREVKPGPYVLLSITDTGVGMPPEVASKAFDPFFTTKPLGQGTGLGLSMVYGFVRQSDGHIHLYSEEGQGTTVRIYLPRHFAANETKAAPVVSHPPILRDGGGRTVLVVEDELVIRSLIVDVLTERGYRTVTAPDAASGLHVLQSQTRVDLLVTDVGLPGMNGRQLADAARALCPDLKVLFITGYAHNAAVGNGLLAGDVQLVTKPFALDVFAEKVESMVHAPG